MFKASKKQKRMMVTQNGVMKIRERRTAPFLMSVFVILLSFALFFGYSHYILAADEFDFGDELFDDFDSAGNSGTTAETGAMPADIGPSGSVAGSGEGEQTNFDLSQGEIAKFEVAPELHVKYFNDDPAEDASRKDPFKPLIEKITPNIGAIKQMAGGPVTQDVPQIPPLDLKLVGVIQAGDRKMAMMTLDGTKYMELFEGDQDSDGQFQVKQINDDSVVIMSFRRNELRNIQLGGK